jgi:hypothetical protein
MPWTIKLLVIANRTVDSPQLRQTIVGRAQRSPIMVTLVAPTSRAGGGAEPAAERLSRACESLREAGVSVEGRLGHKDPMVALQDVWDPRRFDEVVVATLPEESSRWLTVDLPHRVERFTGAQVTHVVVTPVRA